MNGSELKTCLYMSYTIFSIMIRRSKRDVKRDKYKMMKFLMSDIIN